MQSTIRALVKNKGGDLTDPIIKQSLSSGQHGN